MDRIYTNGPETGTGTGTGKISVIPWMDLSRAQQHHILQDMSVSFGKSITDVRRFFRPSCRVWFYREGFFQPNDGIAITFRIGDVEYLDKFFVTKKGKGIGQRFLYNWINSLDSRLVRWRTDDTLAQKFYGKHPAVWTIARHEEYVYQGIGRTVLDTEEVFSWLRLPSAFSSLPDSINRA